MLAESSTVRGRHKRRSNLCYILNGTTFEGLNTHVPLRTL
jgi:hypothetical protein